jgi:gliding motility-associated-like protein
MVAIRQLANALHSVLTLKRKKRKRITLAKYIPLGLFCLESSLIPFLLVFHLKITNIFLILVQTYEPRTLATRRKKPTMTNKTIFLIVSLILTYGFSIGQGTWVQKASFPGFGKNLSAGFSIGNKGYWGTGRGISWICTNEFWEYDPSTNIWTQKANVPGPKRYTGCGFSIGNKGYIGLGNDSTLNFLNDFWEYDPSSNLWTQIADFGGSGRAGSVAFSINNKGYVGTGYIDQMFTTVNDFWEYDPNINLWTQKAVLPGPTRGEGTGFSIGNKGYIGTGCSLFNGWFDDFWEWDQTTNVWTQIANFAGGKIVDASGFSICERGYVCAGEILPGATFTNELWEYIPDVNIWLQKANFGGAARDEAIGLTINNKTYLGFGTSTTNLTDFWEYTPDTLCNDSAIIDSITPPTHPDEKNIFYLPNIFSPNNDGHNDKLFVRGENINNIEFKIYDRWGELVFETNDINRGWDGKYKTKNCSEGVYTFIANVTFTNGETTIMKGNVTIIR